MKRKHNRLDDMIMRLFVLVLTVAFILAMIFTCSSCCSDRIIYREVMVPFDYETYKTWGSSKMKPIGTRALPENLRRCTDEEAEYNITCPRHLRYYRGEVTLCLGN